MMMFAVLTVTTLSLMPRLFTVEPLLTDDERRWIINQAPGAQNPGARTPKTTVKVYTQSLI